MELITNWAEQNNTCWVCGTTKSVKYKTKIQIIDTLPIGDEIEKEVCVCNKCALIHSKPEVD
jgi:hypothetical protein